jgi:hypothetical protein
VTIGPECGRFGTVCTVADDERSISTKDALSGALRRRRKPVN